MITSNMDDLKTKKKKFYEVLMEVSETNSYADAFLSFILIPAEIAYEADKESIRKDRCICGTKIENRFYLYCLKNKKVLTIGSCCMKRFRLVDPSTKQNYLALAVELLKNAYQIKQDQKYLILLNIVLKYIEKLTKFGSKLKLTKKMAYSLQKLTGLKWKWEVWEDYENSLNKGDMKIG